jgi:hypothetical protein
VEVRQLGIVYEAPIDRKFAGTSSEPVLGRMSTSFSLHRLAPGYTSEYTTYKITIFIEVYSKSEWQRILSGDNYLYNTGNYGKYDHMFCPHYLHHRKDVMAPDGSVAVTSANVNIWRIDDNRVNGAAQDEAAVKRIIESVHFLK